MESHSASSVSASSFSENSQKPFVSEPPIPHVPLPSDDFAHIAVQANAAADDLMKTFDEIPPEMMSSDEDQSQCHPKLMSIGILDLEEEGAAFHVESDCEHDFMKLALDSLSDSDLKQWPPLHHADPSSSLSDIPSPSNFFSLPDSGKQSLECTNQGMKNSGGRISCSLSSPGSMDATSLTLELQAALRAAELEVSQLQAQVSSKTQHLEMAQRALVDYEDEVQTLRKQLKVLEGDSESDHAEIQNGLQAHERKLSHENIVKDLWRVKSGTHRIRQSLGEIGDDSGPCKQQEFEVLKENYERLNVQNRELEVGNEELKAELEGISTELRSAVGKVGQYEEKMENLMDENRSLIKEKTKLKTQLIQAQEELMCVLSETPDADEEVTTYRKRLKESQEQREKLYRDLECTKAELARFKSDAASITQIVEEETQQERILLEQQRIERANEERVLQLREVLNSKLREHPDMLKDAGDVSDGSDRENAVVAKEQIHQLQEALALALEAKSLLEEKVQSSTEMPSDKLRLILEDIIALKENFQMECRMALRERTENENIILNLQQEKEALIHQMESVTVGLNQLQEETSRVQNELANKRLSAEEYKIKAESYIRELEIDNASTRHKLAQVREALDLCLEARRELEIRVHQSEVILSEWVRSVSFERMQEEENFTAMLRHQIDSNNLQHVKKAALQAIEHLEHLQEEMQKRMDRSSGAMSSQCETPSSTSDAESPESSRVATHQLRMMKKDLREVTQQRDDALNLLKSQKTIDARRFSEIQELQKELNAALEQYEKLLPKFHEVINGKRELENKVQQLRHELEAQDKRRKEMEAAVVELLSGCNKVLKGRGSIAQKKNQSLMDSILVMKSDLDVFSRAMSKEQVRMQRQTSQKHSERAASNGSRASSSHHQHHPELKPLMDHLKSMVDKERDLRRYFESQTEKLSKLREDTEQRSHWIRGRTGTRSALEGDYPPTETQLRERSMAMKRLSQKDDEISDLLAELSKTRSMDPDMQTLLKGLDAVAHQNRPSDAQLTMDLGERLSRLQECAGALEEQLIAVKTENRELKTERQILLEKVQSFA